MWSTNIFVLVCLICLQGWVRSDSNTTVRAHAPHQNGESRIVGGNVVTNFHQARYAVFLKFWGRNPGTYWTCTGSVIAYHYVLTARHCLLNALRGEVHLGAHNINQEKHVTVLVNVLDHFLVHGKADIGLIHLPSYNIPRDVRISLINLPGKSDVASTYKGLRATAYGWGRYSDKDEEISNDLRYVEVPILKTCGDCSVNETCTSGEYGKGACYGDSGGPLVLRNSDGRDVLIGVTSGGSEHCESGNPSVYVSVNKYLDWISDNSDADVPN